MGRSTWKLNNSNKYILIRRGNLDSWRGHQECMYMGKNMQRWPEKMAIYKLSRVASEDITPADTLILEF